jgi:hypothetical protein
MEGTAFVVQRIAAKSLIGEKYHHELKTPGMGGHADQEQWQQYMVVDIYLTKELGNFYESAQLALSDLAMMAENPGIDENGYPGWRLVRACGAARKMGDLHQKIGTDWMQYANDIAQQVGWRPSGSIAKLAADNAQAHLGKLRNEPGANSLWQQVLKSVLEVHLLLMQMRLEVPDILSNPYIYLEVFSKLPTAPVLKDAEGRLLFSAFDEDQANVFRHWYMFEHFQRQLLFATRLPCPAGGTTHKCPGDPLETKGWNPSEKCPFSMFMSQLGLAEVRFERIFTA